MDSKKSRRRRPEVEGLETLALLSGFAHAGVAHVGAVHAEATKSTPSVAVVALHGTIHATGKLSGETLSVSGSGNLGSVGTASAKVAANLLSPPSTVTLSTKRGNIVLAEDAGTALLTSGSTGTGTYHVAGGTGSYAHSTGSGTITASFSLAKGNKVTLNLKFS